MIYLLAITIALATAGNAKAQTTTDTIQKQYITTELEIPQLKRKRKIQVYLPADYYSSKRKYPVLYMQDAQNIYNKDGVHKGGWGVDSVLQLLPVKQQCIVVGINHGGNQRIAEYSPWDSDYAKGQGIPYTEFMISVLKPYIDAHYRTKADAKHTAIAGSSMGGLISHYATVMHPDVFGSAGVFSPSYWIAPNIYKVTTEAKLKSFTGFFLSCGTDEGNETEYVARMDTLLRNKKLNEKRLPVPLILKGEKHNEHQWMLSFSAFYAWWLKRW